MKIISVIPLKKGILKGDLSYFSSLEINPGDIVYVPLRNKKTLALVTKVEELRDAKSNVKGMNFNLRKVTENKGSSIFLREYLESIFEVSQYFAQNYNNIFTTLIPKIFIEEYDKISKIENINTKTKENNSNVRAEKLLFQQSETDRISAYKTLIRESFAKGKSIFIVMPTEVNVERFKEYLGKGIEQFTFSLHGGNTPKKNLKTYEEIMRNDHPVLIIATPPFLSIPKKDIDTVILEDENSSAYKTISRPHIDLRIFTEIFANKIGAKFILADNILRFETIARKELEDLSTLQSLSFRLDYKGEIKIISKKDTGAEDKTKQKFKVIQDSTVEEIKNTLEKKQNVFVFSLRKGLATMTLCKDCGNTVSCDKCGSPLVLYVSSLGKKRMFVCNRCNDEKDPNTACENCGGWNLIPFGIGTDTVQEFLKEKFPKNKIYKLDKESAKTKEGAKKIIKEFEEDRGSILIGTEMSLFYLNNKVPLSVVASFDSLSGIPNFKIGEKIIKIILDIISFTQDKLLIETKNINDPAILAIEKENLLSYVREELEERKNLNYPPYKRFIKISYLGEKGDTLKAKEALKEIFKDYNPDIFSGFVQKMKNKYTTNALIKIDPILWSLPSLVIGGKIDQNLHKKLSHLPADFEISVDPEDLL